ncbi:hypothetical protein BH10PSE14_BH10PSE14_13600 [soil metagenome]
MVIATGPDRRALLAGAVAGLVVPAHLTAAMLAPGPRLFSGTELGRNPVALGFEKVDLSLPKIKLADGAHGLSLDTLSGKTRIVTLWAEWCVPCLVEARDFAALRRRFAGPGFDIVAVLTASAEKLDFAAATTRLKQARVEDLPLLVEPDGGARLMLGLSPAPSGRGGSLPCTLLVDARGRIRGRSHGAPTAALRSTDASPRAPHVLTNAEKQAMLASDQGTLWASAAGDALITALRGGILDQL